MVYFIAAVMFIIGLLFTGIARASADNVKNIKALLKDDKNRLEAKGSLQVIERRSSPHGFECDGELIFANHSGKTFSYKERYFGSESKASFLRKCENKGEVPVTVVYDKSSPSNHFIKELKPLEVNANSRIGYALIGILFMLLGVFIVGLELCSII